MAQGPITNTDPSKVDPSQLPLLLGPGYEPGYDTNTSGSYETNFNNILKSFTPAQLIQRYSQGDINKFQGTQADRAGFQAYQSAKSILGRDIGADEFAQILPYFQGPDGSTNGNAYLAQLKQQYKLNPQLDPMSDWNKRQGQDFSNDVSGQFKSILGRDATPDELAHFTDAIKTGQTDSYGVGAFLKQQPEYTNAQDKTFREGLNTELTNYDTTAFNRQKGDIISAYGRNGQSAGSSPSLDYALTDLMGQIASNRSNYLANLSSTQYGGNKDLAVGNYKSTLDQMYNQQQNNLGQGQNSLNNSLTRANNGADYQRQMNDLMNYMNSQPKRSTSGFDYLNAGLNTINTGANVYKAFNPATSFGG